MVFPLTADESTAFEALINEVAAAPQNDITATAIERMSVWAVSAGCYTDRAAFISRFDDAPFSALLEWGSLGFWGPISLSVANAAILADLIALLDKAPNTPLDANVIDRLLPVSDDVNFIRNDTKSKDMLKTYPYAALMAFAWWMNVSDSTLPFQWLDADQAL
jgi:hypothetical protein